MYLRIYESCKQCQIQFTGEIENKPDKNSLIIIKFHYRGLYKTREKSKKRRLIGRKRDELKNKLIKENMSASYIQRI